MEREGKMKEILIDTVDFRDFEPVPVIMRLMVKDGMDKKEIENAIYFACKEYCEIRKVETEEFTYKDFDELVPNDICEKYGILKLEIPFEQMHLVYRTDMR